MWKVVHASVAGSSHLSQGTPCQDSCGILTLTSSGEPVLLIAIADGAGSARLSQEGAAFVTQDWLKRAASLFCQSDAVDESTMRDLANAVRVGLFDHVARLNGQPSDYACTLLCAAIFPERALFFQIGDGAWVYQAGETYQCPTWPFQGEYAGETIFLTSNGFELGYQTSIAGKIDAVAGLTDGLERLALKMTEREPSPTFFAPMFAHLATVPPEHAEEQLKLFLSSGRVNERTDDDKTLVLAIRIPCCETP